MTKKEKVLELFHNDLNCAQSIIYVYGEAFGIKGDVANSIAVGFGSGFGRTQQMCGAISGAVMALGARNYDKNKVAESKENVYQKTRELINHFKEKNGSCDCRNLIGVDLSTDEGVKTANEQNLFNLKCKKYLADVCDELDKLL
jgi:C_GCAxxG_C_C family probable redox protein